MADHHSRMHSLSDAILNALSTWNHLGVNTTPAGSARWGRPRPEEGIGYFHQRFASVTQTELEKLCASNPQLKKFTYTNLLTQMNGMKAFGFSFHLYGMRDVQSSLDRPFDLLRANIEAWNVLSGPDQLLIGGGNLRRRTVAYVERSNGSVVAAGGLSTEQKGVIFYVWTDLETFVTSQLGRLQKAFDKNGSATCDLENLSFEGGHHP